MSANLGNVRVLGATEVAGEKVIELRFIQRRNPDWAHRPFFAHYDDTAIWLILETAVDRFTSTSTD